MEKIRIQKFFTDNAVMSRRAAERAIADGRVTVNGETASVGQKIDPDCDTVALDGRQISITKGEKNYIMLNKPRGYVTTLSDEHGRHTVKELVADLGARVYPVGRLDMDSDGLLILTDDGELTLRLTHPRHEIPKIYLVRVKGLDDDKLNRLHSIRELDGYKLAPYKVERVSPGLIRFELYEGRNRQIRRMCAEAGIEITRLSRVAIGELSLEELKSGRWRRLSKAEVDYLYGNK